MRKLSEYFKPADANTSTQRRMQKLDGLGDSPLSDCISCPSSTPPPPRKSVANLDVRGGPRAAGAIEGTKHTSKLTTTQEGTSATLCSIKGVNASSRADQGKLGAVIPDSEGEGTDDSLDLADLDLLLKPKTAKAAKPERKKGKTQKTELPMDAKPSLDVPTYTFSLDALLSEKAKDAEREQTLQRTEALLASVEDDDHMTIPQQLSDKGIVDAAVGNETGGRVLDMLNRREAWRVECTWYFFGHPSGNRHPKPPNVFPTDSLQGWSSRMKEPAARLQMFLSGCVQDMCIIRPNLPTEVVSWLLDELVVETREDLSFSYARTLEACQPQVKQLLDCVRIPKLFELLGATSDAVNLSSTVTMGVAFDGKVQTAVAILVRLSLDDMFTNHGDILIDIEKSIYSLLMSRSESDEENGWDTTSPKLLENITMTFNEPKSQVRLLKILPISSPRTHLFRRRLALTFLFNDHKYLSISSSQLITVDDFSHLLEDPQFTVKHNTDYSKLKALIEILDIAFDDGGMPGKDHSKRVESVGLALRDMSSKIRDTGMASLERTEAKQVIELTQFRLQFAVAKGRKGGSVLEQHFLKDQIGDREGKKQTLLNFGGTRDKKL
ncbi:hypothetical protein L211DRAFT_551271 [Terfezia boudieri ATCC MYA-4762]|uniref:Uncharacterized protein n=1 Tax=Terfezia boudieri ATCC MYA-4762 TaxID=1051890 RepID=A0A3N4M299_9PEZI|nr:hypothetical protein L211DRAFT_551271 [Terfezia boudieri ATCC MYA-4762]